MFREAFRVAMSPRKGPVQINLPRDVLAEQIDMPDMQSPDEYRVMQNPAPAANAVADAARLLTGANDQ